ncbi:hypothetical protein OH791_33670 [Streptomyces anulatus]|uniref:hypothetical protein n=1 Tax=Streptomyces anulatus TaxID=1892 RepID=UPI0038707733|nr:hypothetical protein OH791_33670 [Streptomyces anulatus]
MTTQTETTKTPQEIGVHALAKAVKYADQADRYASSERGTDEFNHGRVATYGGLAAVYAEVAKAAAALAAETSR